MTDLERLDRLQAIEAVEAIKLLKSRYFRLIDEKNWAAMRDLLADDLEFHHPTIGSYTDADTTIAAVAQRIGRAGTVHQGHDPEVTLDGDTAEGLWGLQSFVYSPDDPSVQITRYARYRDRFRRQGDSWKITHITFAYLYDPVTGTARQA
jgi:hypothetical protein